MRTRGVAATIALAVVMWGLNSASAFGAVTVTVDRTDDPAVSAAGSGAAACTAAANDCSLRGATLVANANPGSTINIPAGTYQLATDGSSEAGICTDATVGDLDIAGNNTTITGAGSGSTIIQQTTAHDRVICVDQFLVHNFTFHMSGATIEGGKETFGVGGGGMTAGDQGDSTTLSDIVFSGNVANKTSGGGSPVGGGLGFSGGSLSLDSVQFLNNTAVGSGGGAYISANYTGCVHPCAGTYTITNSTFGGNTAGGNGGGLIVTQGNSYTVSGSTFTNNTAQSSAGGGGGLYDESGNLSLTTSTFAGNAATGTSAKGGGIGSADGSANTMSVSATRFTGNSAAAGGNGLSSGSTTATTATNNWWGCNGGPSAAGCDTVAGSPTVNPWIVLKTTASPSAVDYGTTSTLTASFLQNSSGTTLTTGQIAPLIGLPVTWTNAAHGTLSGQQTSVQSNGTATATFTAGSTSADCGTNKGSAEAKVDNVQSADAIATAAVTINCPDLTVVKTNNVSGQASLGSGWTWTLTGNNGGAGAATYSNGQTILTDNLPNANIAYGTVTETNVSGVTGTIDCSINGSDDLTCTANGSVTISAAGSFTVSFTATPSAAGSFANPRTGGSCGIDPTNDVPETSDANNSCSDSVTVSAPDLTVGLSNNVSGATTLGQSWTWKLHAANGSASATATFHTGATILVDQLDSSGHLIYGSPAAGNATNVTNLVGVSCSITANTLTCTATGTVVIGTSGSFDVTFTATPTAAGTYTNPRSLGTCAIDPGSAVTESDETNNDCTTDSVTVTAPDLTATQADDVSGSVTKGQGWNWTLTVNNSGAAPATFGSGTTLLHDDLDNSGKVTFGTPVVQNTPGVTNSADIKCAVDGADTLTCTANGAAVTLGATTGSFQVKLPVNSVASGTAASPRAAGTCAVDPGGVVAESNESNNACNADSVTINASTDLALTDVGSPDPSVTAGSSGGVDNLTHTITLTNNGPDDNGGAQVVLSFPSGLPTGVTVDTVTPSVGSYASNTKTWTVSSLASGAHATLTVAYNVSGSTANSATVQSHAAASVTAATTVDSNSANDAASRSTIVHQPATVSPAPSSWDFGGQTVGVASAAKTFTITNTGGETLTVSADAITGSDAGQFSEQSENCTTAPSGIAPGNSCSIAVSFDPTTAGLHTHAAIHVVSNDPAGATDVALSGTGNGPQLSPSPGAKDFGSVRVGSTSSAQTFTLTNSGTATLNVATVALAGTDAGQYATSNDACSGHAVTAGHSCAIDVAFKPTSTGSHNSASLDVTSDAPSSVDHLALSGTGTLPALSVAPSSLDFGSQRTGTTSAPQTLTITDTGTDTLTVGAVSLGGAGAAQYELSADKCSGHALAPGGKCTVDVSFAPSGTGPVAAAVKIASDDPASPASAGLTGVGTASTASVRLAPAVKDFGNVPVGTRSRPATFTLSNSGTGAVTVQSVATTGTDAPQYRLLADTCSGRTVPASGRCTFMVVFRPTAPGNHNRADITVHSDDGTSTATLRGRATADNRFSVRNLRVRASGAVSFDVAVRGAGEIDVLETAWKRDEAAAATVLLQPAPGRFTFARAHFAAEHAGTVHVTTTPNPRGRRLVEHHHNAVRIRLWVTFQPTGGRLRKLGFLGVFVTK